jgi:hypothetical protein
MPKELLHFRSLVLTLVTVILVAPVAWSQSTASGTVTGTVTDSTGAVIVAARVVLKNPVTGYEQVLQTDATGSFRFNNVPFNNYRIEVTQPGFAPTQQDVSVRSVVPVSAKIALAVENVAQTVNVEATGLDIVETAPYAHVDVDLSSLDKLPVLSPGAGLSDAIMLSSPGVVADSNGFFHPLGDHAQTSFSIDGQPISDQQSKAFSTQIPVNAIQNMEVVTGTPNAEFGDKTSLVVNTTTRSGLGIPKPTGSFVTKYGSFGTPGEEASIAFGSARMGYFLAANGLRSGRFLDTPEFRPIHALGNNENAFNRFDFNPTNNDAIHVNVFLARNWFQVPNTLDQFKQDQRQKTLTFNVAPGYQRTFSSKLLLTINPFVRHDSVNFYPSGNPFNDTPATVAQHRDLTNYGVRGDISYATKRHNIKIGGQIMSTRLNEQFNLGITDNLFNAVCADGNGNPVSAPGVSSAGGCIALGLSSNPNFVGVYAPFDLTRGGSLFNFAATGSVNEYAAYIQDSITVGGLNLNPGLRIDRYDGVNGIQDKQAEPRLGLSYKVGSHGSVLHAGYARTMETPYNENLLVATSPASGPLIASFSAQGQAPVGTGHRNQYNLGFSQAFAKYIEVDFDYFWKFTNTAAYDFTALFNTPITFPISWPKSKLNGASFRISSTNLHGFQWYTTMGHNSARFFPADAPVFRIDHDQVFQQTSNFRYQWKNKGPWVDFTWRYDSGLVASAVHNLADALSLTPAQQSAIGFFCGNQAATPSDGITSCNTNYGATRLRIAGDTQNDDNNPSRIAPRHLFDIGFGTDNLYTSGDGKRITLRFAISNLTNKLALYNFLSTFSGTHFVSPRSYEGAIGFNF